MKLSFQSKLLLSVALLLLVSLLILSLVSANLLRKEIAYSIQSEVESSLQLTTSLAGGWLNNKMDLVKATAKEIKSDTRTWEDQLTLVRHAGNFELAYIGTADGSMFQSTPPVPLPANYDPRTRPWYTLAQSAQKMIITPPFRHASTNELIISISAPLDQKRGDIISTNVLITDLVRELLSIQTRWTSQLWMLDTEGKVLAHANSAYLEKTMQNLLPGFQLPKQGQQTLIQHENRQWITSSAVLPATGWTFVLMVDANEARESLRSMAWQVAFTSLLIILLSCFFLYWLINLLSGPLKKLAAALEDISSGEADLTQRLTVRSDDEFGRMSQAFNRFIERLQLLLRQVQDLSKSLDREAEQTMQQINQSREQLNEQQGEVSQLASAVNQMSVATSEIAGNAEQTAAKAHEAADSTREGKELMKVNQADITQLAEKLNNGMQTLHQVDGQVQNITSILATIQGVAEQTNLLALNAAIEAARAGEHGRGFAVVADEVRSLSQRTHEATEEIREMIDRLQNSTEQAVKSMEVCHQQAGRSVEGSRKAAERLDLIDQANTHISDMAAQIASAVEEQNAVTSEMSNNAHSIQGVAEQMLGQAEQSQQRAEELHQAVNELRKLVASFKL